MMYAADIGDQFADLLGSVIAIALKVVIFLAIMALGWFVGAWIYRFLARFLRRVGFDRAVERGGLHRLLGGSTASELTARLVELAFLLFVLQLAFGIFGPNPVSTLIGDVVAWLPQLFVAIVIVVVAAAIAGWVRELVRGALDGVSYGRTLGTVAQVLILTLGIIAALDQLGVAASVTLPILITALATIGGILVVGVGGGLIRPMQHRWERMLNRAETETSLAADTVRSRRAADDRNTNRPGRFDQPAYQGNAPADTKPGASVDPATPVEPGPPAEPPG